MDFELVLVLLAVAAFIACDLVAVIGTVDALTQPRAAWERAGFRRISWVWQALGVVALPLTLVYSGVYFVRVRPRLARASADISVARIAATVGPAAGPERTDVIRFRTPWLQAILLGAAGLIGALIGIALVVWQDGDLGSPFPWSFLAGYGFAAVPAIFLHRFSGTALTPDVLRTGMLRRSIPWQDVAGITTGSLFGSRSVYAVTWNGRRRRLRAPATMLGIGRARFAAEVATIENYWLATSHAR